MKTLAIAYMVDLTIKMTSNSVSSLFTFVVCSDISKIVFEMNWKQTGWTSLDKINKMSCKRIKLIVFDSHIAIAQYMINIKLLIKIT